jgi:glycosyltransferase involved in cell wall biosynthesis
MSWQTASTRTETIHAAWLVLCLTHYHSARMRAFCSGNNLRGTIIELTNVGSFRAMERDLNARDTFERITLFPGTPYGERRFSGIREKLKRVLNTTRPDVVCVNGWALPGSGETIAECMAADIPMVVMSESSMEDSARRYFVEAAKARMLALFGAGLVGGRRHREYLESLGVAPSRIFEGYDAVDNDHFQSGSERARLSADQLRSALGLPRFFFLACSRFESKKNLERLVEAYSVYRKRTRTRAWQLVIVGDGVLRPKVVALTQRLGLTESVLLPGSICYEELPAYYGLAKVFIHASTTEQWGLVVNEAMASGLPVLVSERCGCVPELVRPGRNGLTFDPFNTEEIATKMIEISAPHYDTRLMGMESQKIASEWGPSRFAAGLTQAATAAMKAPRPKSRLIDRALLGVLIQNSSRRVLADTLFPRN